MRTRTTLLAGTAAITIMLGAGYTLANAATAPVIPTYTGCLATEGSNKGKLFAIATGPTPTRDCTSTEKPIKLSSGDITSIAAGNGVRVVGTEFGLPDGNGEVSLELAPSYRLPQTCTEGQLLEKKASAWGCRTPAPVGRTVYGWANAEHEVGNDWSVLGNGLDVPAGSYVIEAKAQIAGSFDTGSTYANCRLDLTGVQGVDRAEVYTDGVAHAPITMAVAVTRNAPFRVAVLCRDEQTDTTWSNLRIIATPTASTAVPLVAG